ncbi:MAG: phytoene/squalene synthase family protein [Bryobacteraceae bacterium]|nr:phytoene/squalene synthase family protein [Bryobacteraceae bacterium]
MRTDTGLEALYREAARVTAAGSKSFYFATRFFPEEMARPAHAVYWFCRHTDDLVDEAPSTLVGRRQLEEWSAQVENALNGHGAEHPALRLFMEAVRRFEIPAEYPLELLEGMRMDLERVRYRDFAELRTFCYRVASVVGLMMSHVIGFREPALRYAEDLGIAMQLTNILRDVGEDLKRGRIYLPAEEMEKFGYSESDLMNRRRNAAFRRLMEFQTARARHYYRQSAPGIALLNREGRFAVKVAADVYSRILKQIEESDFDVFERRAVVPGAVKYWLTARAMLAARSA